MDIAPNRSSKSILKTCRIEINTSYLRNCIQLILTNCISKQFVIIIIKYSILFSTLSIIYLSPSIWNILEYTILYKWFSVAMGGRKILTYLEKVTCNKAIYNCL